MLLHRPAPVKAPPHVNSYHASVVGIFLSSQQFITVPLCFARLHIASLRNGSLLAQRQPPSTYLANRCLSQVETLYGPDQLPINGTLVLRYRVGKLRVSPLQNLHRNLAALRLYHTAAQRRIADLLYYFCEIYYRNFSLIGTRFLHLATLLLVSSCQASR